MRKLGFSREKSPFLGIIFTMPTVLLTIGLIFIPIGYAVRLSFFDTSLKNPAPIFVFLDGYIKMFKDPDTWTVLVNSFIWTISVTGLQFLMGLGSALALNKKFPGRSLVRSVVVLPWVIPGVVAAMVWTLVLDAQLGFLGAVLRWIGLLDGYIDFLGTPSLAMPSVIIAATWKGFGFSTLMYMAALQGTSVELYEAAAVDGANALKKFFYITMPSISHIISMTLTLTGIWTFNYFEIIYNMTGGGPLRLTHIMPTYIYELAFRNFNMGESSRFALISIFIISIFSAIYIYLTKKQDDL